MQQFRNFNTVTGNKFSHTLALLAYALRALPGQRYVIKYSNDEELVYEGTYTYENICKFDNQNPSYRDREPVLLLVDDTAYDIKHDTYILDPARKGPVSNKFGVFFPECWDLGRTLVTTTSGEKVRDCGRTFANYLGIMEDGNIVIHGPKFFTSVLSTQFGLIGFDGIEDVIPPTPTPVDRDGNTLVFVGPNGTKKKATLAQSFELDSGVIAAKTFGGAICLIALLDAMDRDAKNAVYAQYASPITSNPKYANLEFAVERQNNNESVPALHNMDLELLYDRIHMDYSGNALVNKLRIMVIDRAQTGVNELRVKLDKGTYDLYSEGSVETNQTCAVHAAAACFWWNTTFKRDLSMLSGIYFAYLGILMSKGYVSTFTIGETSNQSVQLDTNGIMGTDLDNDKQYTNNVYFSGDLDPNTALFFRVLRVPAIDNSYVVAKLPGRTHYVCGKWDSSTGTVQVVHDSVVNSRYAVGQVVTPDGRVTTFSGVQTAFDGEIFTERQGYTRHLRDAEIAFRFTGIGGTHA